MVQLSSGLSESPPLLFFPPQYFSFFLVFFFHSWRFGFLECISSLSSHLPLRKCVWCGISQYSFDKDCLVMCFDLFNSVYVTMGPSLVALTSFYSVAYTHGFLEREYRNGGVTLIMGSRCERNRCKFFEFTAPWNRISLERRVVWFKRWDGILSTFTLFFQTNVFISPSH